MGATMAGPSQLQLRPRRKSLLPPAHDGRPDCLPVRRTRCGQVAIDANFNPIGPHFISRNLTPDYTGRPEGGNTFEQFLQIIRHGTDLDHLHPPCMGASPSPNCLFALPGINPVDGNLLQVMPRPVFNNMSTEDLLAIYTYLSAIPCLTGPATPADLPLPSRYMFKTLHNDCTPPPQQ